MSSATSYTITVSNLDEKTTESDIKSAFSEYGSIQVLIVKPKASHDIQSMMSLPYAKITFTKEAEYLKAASSNYNQTLKENGYLKNISFSSQTTTSTSSSAKGFQQMYKTPYMSSFGKQ